MNIGLSAAAYLASAGAAQKDLRSNVCLTHKGEMLLTDYLRQNELSDAAFGARVGRSSQAINRIKRGIASPSLDLAVAIVRASGGAVSVDDIAAARTPVPAES